MYLPFVKCVAQEDRMGNLMIWQGINKLKPEHEDQIAYIQNSQQRSDIYANCFDFTEISLMDIENGYPTIILLHEDTLMDIFS
jgi:hypothetical protein